MFTLAAEGKTNRKGLPNPFRLAVIADAHFDTVQLPCPPALLQQAALATAAPLGRLLGYQAHTAHPASITRPHTRPDRTYDRGRPGQPRAQQNHRKTPAGDAVRPSARDCLTDAGTRGLCISSADSSAPPSDVGASYHHADASHRPCIARDRRTA